MSAFASKIMSPKAAVVLASSALLGLALQAPEPLGKPADVAKARTGRAHDVDALRVAELKLAETRRRLSLLPRDVMVLYGFSSFEGEGRAYTPREAMLELSQRDGNWRLGHGGDTLNTAVYLARCGAAAGLQVLYATGLGEDSLSSGLFSRANVTWSQLADHFLTSPWGIRQSVFGVFGNKLVTSWCKVSHFAEVALLLRGEQVSGHSRSASSKHVSRDLASLIRIDSARPDKHILKVRDTAARHIRQSVGLVLQSRQSADTRDCRRVQFLTAHGLIGSFKGPADSA